MKILGGNQNEHSCDSHFMLYKDSGWPKEPKLLGYDYGIPRTRLWRSRYSKCRCLPTQQHGFPKSSKVVLRWDAAFGSEADQALFPLPYPDGASNHPNGVLGLQITAVIWIMGLYSQSCCCGQGKCNTGQKRGLGRGREQEQMQRCA